MANTDFSILLKAVLDESGIPSDLEKIQKIVKKYSVEIIPELKSASLKNQIKSISADIANDFNKTFGTSLTGADIFKAFENRAKQIEKANAQIQSQKENFDKRNLNAIDYEIKKREEHSKAYSKLLKQQMQDEQALAEQANKTQYKIETEKYSTGIAKIQNDLKSLSSVKSDEFIKAEQSANDLYVTYQKMISATSDQSRIDAEKEYQKVLEKTKNLLTQVKLQYDKKNDIVSPGDSKRVNMINTLNNYLQKNTAITREVKNQIKEFINTLSSSDDMTVGAIDNINTKFKNLDTTMRATGKLGLSFPDKFKQAWEKFGGWSLATGTLMTIFSQIKRIPQEVYKIDTAMTNLYKVTDESSKAYDKFLSSSTVSAQQLGRSLSSLIEQSATWAKLGFGLSDSAELAKISSIYANVGEVDDSTAVSDLITAMKAFNIEASDSITIVDSLNKLGNEFATDAKSLGEGLSNAASAMSLGGMSLEKTLALLTGGAEITQEAGELGNALKVGQMRVMGMKGALEELGEEYDNIESVSKIQTHILNLTKGQVNIMNDADPTKFKEYYDILQDVAEVYGSLDQTTQADLLETLFGKQRGNQGAALIQAFQSGQIQKAYQAALNSEGSAYQEQERWMSSLEAKIQQLEAAFQSLSNTILDSNFLKDLVDSGTNSINFLDKFIDKFGVLPTLFSAASTAFSFKNFGRDKMYSLINMPKVVSVL